VDRAWAIEARELEDQLSMGSAKRPKMANQFFFPSNGLIQVLTANKEVDKASLGSQGISHRGLL
jgi:hypothetical protein